MKNHRDYGDLVLSMRANLLKYSGYSAMLIVVFALAFLSNVFSDIASNGRTSDVVVAVLFMIVVIAYCLHCLTYRADFYESGCVIGPLGGKREVAYSEIVSTDLFSRKARLSNAPLWILDLILKEDEVLRLRSSHYNKLKKVSKEWQAYLEDNGWPAVAEGEEAASC